MGIFSKAVTCNVDEGGLLGTMLVYSYRRKHGFDEVSYLVSSYCSFDSTNYVNIAGALYVEVDLLGISEVT